MRYRFGDYQLDVQERQLIRNGDVVYLRPRTFAMLRYLVQRSQHLVEKRELLDALWPGTIVTENALSQSIKEVRHALADDAHHPRYLETVPRVGYRFLSRVEQLWGSDGCITSAVAQEAYVKGRYFLEKRSEAGFHRAKELFQAAIDQASDFAPAYVGLADCHNLLCNYDLAPPVELAPHAKAAAQKAIQLEPHRTRAYASLGFVQMYYDWDGARAQHSLRRATELDGNNVDAHHWLGLCHLMQGQIDKAMQELLTAKSLDPLSLIILTNIGWVHYFARQYDAASQSMREAIDMDPHFPTARVKLAWCLEQMGLFKDAVGELTRALQLVPQSLAIALHLAEAHALAGNHAAARTARTRVLQRQREQYVPRYWVATASLALGEQEEALQWLDQSYLERSGWLTFLRGDPKLDPLRGIPAFEALQHRVSSAGSADGCAQSSTTWPSLAPKFCPE